MTATATVNVHGYEIAENGVRTVRIRRVRTVRRVPVRIRGIRTRTVSAGIARITRIARIATAKIPRVPTRIIASIKKHIFPLVRFDSIRRVFLQRIYYSIFEPRKIRESREKTGISFPTPACISFL